MKKLIPTSSPNQQIGFQTIEIIINNGKQWINDAYENINNDDAIIFEKMITEIMFQQIISICEHQEESNSPNPIQNINNEK